MATKVLFHSLDGTRHCCDGFAAAWAVWRLLGDKAEYLPCVHQQEPPPVEKGDFVIIVDLSFPRAVLLDWASRADVLVFDHHKTAQEDLRGLEFARFDMDRSGAELAWEHFMRYDTAPPLIRYVADRDLWKKQLPYTEEIHRALSSFPQDFEVWKTLAKLPNYVEFMGRIGAPLQREHEKAVAEVADSAEWRMFGDHAVLCTSTTRNATVSDALNLLCREYPHAAFAANYSEQGGKIKFELRSVGEFDVSAIAKEFGGGGHRNAAGFSVDAATVDERLPSF